MKVYFITRFTIFDPVRTAWKVSRLPIEEYKTKLFSTERLNNKYLVFEKMTLPSILNQTNKNYEWIIMSSEYLPNEYKERLNKLIASYPQIKLYYVKCYNEFFDILAKYPFEPNYATIRLDDDDTLSPSYVQAVQKYKDKAGSIITFPYGHNFKLEKDKFIIKKEERFCPHIAVGLCGINMNIYTTGDHSKLGKNKKYNVIHDNTKNMYNQFCSPYCDTARKF